MLVDKLHELVQRAPKGGDRNNLAPGARRLLKWNWDRLRAEAWRLDNSYSMLQLRPWPAVGSLFTQLHDAVRFVYLGSGHELHMSHSQYLQSYCCGCRLRLDLEELLHGHQSKSVLQNTI